MFPASDTEALETRVLAYHLSVTFRRAIQRSPETQRSLAKSANLTPSQMTMAIGGLRFGPLVKARFDAMGAHLRVPSAKRFREVVCRG